MPIAYACGARTYACSVHTRVNAILAAGKTRPHEWGRCTHECVRHECVHHEWAG